jgi:hypothetical protein
MTTSFHIPYNSLFTDHPTIGRSAVSTIENVVKKKSTGRNRFDARNKEAPPTYWVANWTETEILINHEDAWKTRHETKWAIRCQQMC